MNKDIRSLVSQNKKLLYCHSCHSDTYMGGDMVIEIFSEGGLGAPALLICLRPRSMGIRPWPRVSHIRNSALPSPAKTKRNGQSAKPEWLLLRSSVAQDIGRPTRPIGQPSFYGSSPIKEDHLVQS